MSLNLSDEDREFLTSPEDLLKQFSLSSINAASLDFLAYRIYLDPYDATASENEQLSPHDQHNISHLSNDLQRILKFKDAAMDYLNEIMSNYLWHKDTFQMKIIYDSTNPSHLSLGGIVEFGDNIEDEWFIVWLLFELSKQFPIMSISITDMDGEFLLIESATNIPDWLGPENSENRVWIRNGKIYLIPLDEPGRMRNGSMQLEHALNYLRSTRSRPNKGILKCIMTRLSNFPASGIANQHKSVCLLPSKVAYLLSHNPQLVATAINTLCSIEHDKFYSKTLKSMEYFNPIDVVPVMITFTRALYAQLTFLQRFHIPQRFHQIQSSIQQNMTWNTHVSKAFDLGTRLTCGLELAYQFSKNNFHNFQQKQMERNVKKTSVLNQLGFHHETIANLESYSFLFNDFICLDSSLIVDKIRLQFENEMNENEANLGGAWGEGPQFNDSPSSHASLMEFLQVFKEPIPIFEKIENVFKEEGEGEGGEKIEIKYSSIGESESDEWLHLTPEEFEKNMEDRIAHLVQQQQEEQEEKKQQRQGAGGGEKQTMNKGSSHSRHENNLTSSSSFSSSLDLEPIGTTPPLSETKPSLRKPVNTLYNKPPPTLQPSSQSQKRSEGSGGAGGGADYDSDDDSMISNIWKPKQNNERKQMKEEESKPTPTATAPGSAPGPVDEQQSFDALQSIVRGMDAFLKTYSDYSGVEGSIPEGEIENENEIDLGLSSTETAVRSDNKGLTFDPLKLMSLLSKEDNSTTTATATTGTSVNEDKLNSRPTLDQPAFKTTKENMRKSITTSFQSNTPTPLKPTLSTPNSHYSHQYLNEGDQCDLSSRFHSSSSTNSSASASSSSLLSATSLPLTPQLKVSHSSSNSSLRTLQITTPIQPHRVSVSFDNNTSVLTGVAYAITPPRSRKTPPKLPTHSTPHPHLMRTFSDEEEEEEEVMKEEREEEQGWGENLNELDEEEFFEEEDEENENEENEEDNQIDSDDEEINEAHEANGYENEEEFMKEYMEALDEELAHTTLLETFERFDNSHEINVEKNLLTNLLESHASQNGSSGPASNLLSQLGVALPSPPSLTSKKNI